ncbi:MAG TPA: pyruvate synthase subunit PorB [Smithellaceae bacterium]|jgi:pyruvate ferredoxin oxidoreductase beta subunit|nr:pyruvate synthase subunit beta [Syntrophaceae bacterium]HPL97455.1 pyruvate synthase subunit PorB [Smithellaceae bacterium]HPV50017.1 pyruvate synthase subunit PorB [Smithellaceae bacterium]
MNIVENFDLYAPRLINKRELLSSGHRACSGCAEVLAVRLMAKALGEDTVIASATGCMEIISSMFPTTAWQVPWIHVAFENAAAVASGVEAGLKALKKKGKIDQRYVKVVGMAGDGGTMDIGFQALSGAMERGHDMIYVCFDNEAYMNTGIQRSSGTPMGASTTTAPAGKVSIGQKTWKKNMPEIMAAHNIPYVATVCPSYPLDFVRKFEKARSIEGPSYIHCFSVCPTGWRTPTHTAVSMGRLAVEAGVFPLYEIENGHYRISPDMPKKLRPITDYFKPQGRFRHLTADEIATIQQRVNNEFKKLKEKEKFLKTGIE